MNVLLEYNTSMGELDIERAEKSTPSTVPLRAPGTPRLFLHDIFFPHYRPAPQSWSISYEHCAVTC